VKQVFQDSTMELRYVLKIEFLKLSSVNTCCLLAGNLKKIFWLKKEHLFTKNLNYFQLNSLQF